MALTKVSTDGVKSNAINTAKIINGSIQSEDIADNQIIEQKILDGAVSLAKLPHGDTNNDGKFLRANNGADPSFETVSIPASVGGANGVDFNDSVKARFGTDNDLEIFHDGSGCNIRSTSSKLEIRSPDLLLQNSAAEKYFRGISDGAVELYHDNAKKLETMTNGIRVQGGIMFGSDTADANVLDDYEEGTINNQVVLNGYGYVGANSQAPNMTYDGGKYVKIGNMVYVHMRIKIGSGNSTNGNGVVFGIMPFYADFGGTESLLASHLGCYMNSCSSGGENVITDTYGGSKYYYGVRKMTSSGITGFTGSNGGSGFDLAVNGWYQIE